MINKVKNFFRAVGEDIANYNTCNESERAVLESHYFSSYKGKFVLRTNLKRSGSFGILFISNYVQNRAVPEDEVRHEYGHTVQLYNLGAVKYALCIGFPSLFQWGSDPAYYRRPWEITADIFGGVQSRSYPGCEWVGYDYLEKSKKWGPFVWFTIE